MPQIDYLPPVKRAAVDAFFNFPPGMSPERVNREIAPMLLAAHAAVHGRREGAAAEQLVPQRCGRAAAPSARASSTRTDIGELERIVRDEIVVGFPDTRAFASEGELFGSFGGSARAIAIHLQHSDGDALARARRSRPQVAVANDSRRERAGLAERRRRHAGAARQSRRPSPGRSRLAPTGPGHGGAHARRRHSGWANTSTATAAWPSSCAATARTTSRGLGSRAAGHAAGRRAQPRRTGAGRYACSRRTSCAASIAAAR